MQPKPFRGKRPTLARLARREIIPDPARLIVREALQAPVHALYHRACIMSGRLEGVAPQESLAVLMESARWVERELDVLERRLARELRRPLL